MNDFPTMETWIEYSRRKEALPDNLTNEEYEAEIDKICDELGI